jgi:hypothetical protein
MVTLSDDTVVWISDDDEDEWQPEYGDFEGATSSGTSSADDFDFIENPLLELGHYDEAEDTSEWS